MKVTVKGGTEEGAGGGLGVKCSAAERRVTVERGDGANRKIVFSSTFDAVVDASGEEVEGDEELFATSLAPAVAAAAEGKTGIVVCVGSDLSKRAALLRAAASKAVPALLVGRGGLRVSAINIHWEVATDLVGDTALEGAPSIATGGTGGLWGGACNSVTDAAEAEQLLLGLEGAAAAAEAAAVGAAGGGHLAVQLAVDGEDGRLLLVDVAAVTQLAAPEILKPTLCHTSYAMLSKVLAKPSQRPAAAELPLLTRLLSPLFDAGPTSATTVGRLLLCVTPRATQEVVDLLRTAQAAGGKGVSGKGKRDKAGADAEARRAAVVETLQKAASTVAPVASIGELEEKLRAAVGDGSGLQAELSSATSELAELRESLEAVRREGGGEAAMAAAAREAEAEAAAMAAEEAALSDQISAERAEAEALVAALRAAEERADANTGVAEKTVSKRDLKEQVERYERAVETAWSDVQRAQKEAEETEERFDRAREVARKSAAEKEEMESTLLDVAADLENLARNYRQHGSPAMAVPLYVSALAIFEKTLGPEHPQVASNLVNLGNAFCDQQKHIDAVPVYLRALAIDEKALGHDHPEVAMDLSNLGIAYRALGRADIASGLFERAHKLMLAAVGPDDPKTKAILRNLG